MPYRVHVAPTTFGRPLVLELVGPAGAGKSVLASLLAQRDPSVQPVSRARRLRDLPRLAGRVLALGPTIAGIYRDAPESPGRHVRHVLRLEAFSTVLSDDARSRCRAVIFDEGPVFTLARLRTIAHPDVGDTHTARYWRGALATWADRLDLIVWLDASDAVLAQRIRGRAKPHRVKEDGDEAISRFLDGYRAAYEDVLSAMRPDAGAGLLRFRTDVEPLTQVADGILTFLTDGPRRAARDPAPADAVESSNGGRPAHLTARHG